LAHIVIGIVLITVVNDVLIGRARIDQLEQMVNTGIYLLLAGNVLWLEDMLGAIASCSDVNERITILVVST